MNNWWERSPNINNSNNFNNVNTNGNPNNNNNANNSNGVCPGFSKGYSWPDKVTRTAGEIRANMQKEKLNHSQDCGKFA